MAKKNRKARRQRAIAARQNAAQNAKGSFVANELHNLYGSDEKDVIEAMRWRAKKNVTSFFFIYLLIFGFLAVFTYNTIGTAPGKAAPFAWIVFAALFIVQFGSLRRYMKVIKNA